MSSTNTSTTTSDTAHPTEDPARRVATWGDGAPIGHSPFRELVGGAETADRLVVIAVDMPGREHVPAHTHVDEDQITIVIRGRVGGSVGSQEVVIEEGGVVFMPKGVPHAVWNLGDDEARLLEIYTPSGMEEVFAGMRPLVPPSEA